jgi:hypothetical protein
MSRRDSPSLKVRGVPKQILARLDALARSTNDTRNGIARDVIRSYALGSITPNATPRLLDRNKKGAPYGDDTAPLAISGIPAAEFAQFMERAKAEGWLSKNALIIELLRERVSPS